MQMLVQLEIKPKCARALGVSASAKSGIKWWCLRIARARRMFFESTSCGSWLPQRARAVS